MSNVGPWFKCYPDRFVKGMDALSIEEQAFYTQLVMRMYDGGDAIRATDKVIAKWCNSNVRRWKRVRESLIASKRIYELPCGGLIDEQALMEMSDFCTRKKSKVSPKIYERIAKLKASLRKHMEIISKTVPKNPMVSIPTIDKEYRENGDFPPDGAAALEGLRAYCGEGKQLEDFNKLKACITGWNNGTFYVRSGWVVSQYSDSLHGPLKLMGVTLAVESSQPTLTAIEGGQSALAASIGDDQ